MHSTISRRLAPVRRLILPLGALMVLIAASVSAPAVVRAHAKTPPPGNVTLTLTCTGAPCSGVWFWRQGETDIGTGSIAGNANSTITETTNQPAAADALNFGVHGGGTYACGQALFEYITPGSAINFTATVPSYTSSSGSYPPLPTHAVALAAPST
jgi:hypothetical protein